MLGFGSTRSTTRSDRFQILKVCYPDTEQSSEINSLPSEWKTSVFGLTDKNEELKMCPTNHESKAVNNRACAKLEAREVNRSLIKKTLRPTRNLLLSTFAVCLIAGACGGRGSSIAVVSEGEIVLISDSGSDTRKLLLPDWKGEGNVLRWSPDGREVAFHQYSQDDDFGREFLVALADADGASVRPITNQRTDGGTPVWSPDGTLIALDGVGERSPSGVSVVGIDAEESRFLTVGSSPTWSPDSETVAVKRFRMAGVDVEAVEIWLVAVDGSTERMVAEIRFDVPTTLESELIKNPFPKLLYLTWSPDGKRLSFSANPGGRMGLFVLGLENGYLDQVVFSATDNDNAWLQIGGIPHIWAPDSETIIYEEKNKEYETRLVSVNADGNQRRALAGPNAFSPIVSPNGEELAFCQSNVDQVAQLFVMHIDGSDLRALDHEGCPVAWIPA